MQESLTRVASVLPVRLGTLAPLAKASASKVQAGDEEADDEDGGGEGGAANAGSGEEVDLD